jgi:hypothetical protein
MLSRVLILAMFSMAPLAEAKVVDLRVRTDAAGAFDIGFCARPSPDTVANKPGHAFAAFSHEGADGQRDFLAIGHTVGAQVSPGAAAWSYFGEPVSGYLNAENYSSIEQRCLVARVNEEDYVRAKQLTRGPLEMMGLVRPESVVFESYKLGSQDCMTFLIDVARTLKPRGLSVPDRKSGELPMSYVERLSAAN